MLGSLLALVLLVPAQWLGVPTLQPRTVSSPSGQWTLFVDPTAKSGAGPAHVVVSRDGQVAWEADVPFTLWEAQITDAGFAVGYAFTEGRAPRGEFVVAIFAPDGRQLLDERAACTWSPHPDGPPGPSPLGMFAQPALDRFVVRVADDDMNRRDEQWWMSRISTGERLGHVHPKQLLESSGTLNDSLDARPVSGTPLTLVQWYHFDFQARGGEEVGTRFVLVDEDWKPVWTLAFPKDYCDADEDVAERLRQEAWKQGGVLDAGQPGRFELRHVATKERITYEVLVDSHADHGWAVHEVARAPYVTVAEEPVSLPALSLRSLPTVPLDAVTPPSGPVHDVLAFDFDAEGHVLLVRGEWNAPTATLLRLGLDGAILGQASFQDPTAESQGRRAWHAFAQDRWLFTYSPYGDDALSRAWIVEAVSGAAQEIEDFAGPSLEAACATPDGGLALIGGYHRRYTINDSLLALDAKGRRRWEIVQGGYSGGPEELMACEDVAVDAVGAVLVLDSTRDAVLVFSPTGEYQRTVKLPEAWGGEPVYPLALRVLPNGDWLVNDANTRSWHRMNPQGEDRGGFAARREDGGIEVGRSVRVDAAGNLWGTDGTQLFAFDADGVAHTRLGAPPVADVLEEPSHVQVDALGRIAVSDRRTHAVHLFDGAGRRTLALRPDPTDFDTAAFAMEDIAADSSGRTALQIDSFKGRFIAFAADGHRGGVAELGGEHVAFVPGSTDRWVSSRWLADNPLVRRLTAEGQELVKLDRRPDHSFFTEVEALGCTPDGSVWVLSAPNSNVSSAGLALDLFSPTGEPQRSLSLAAAPTGYWNTLHVTSRWLLVSSFEDTALLISLADGAVSRVHCDGVSKQGCAFGFSPDGAELWCVLQEPLELRRFALPE